MGLIDITELKAGRQTDNLVPACAAYMVKSNDPFPMLGTIFPCKPIALYM